MDNKLSNFEVIGKLGVGAYSQVYKVKRIHDGQIYALKKVKLFDVGEREKQNALNEVRIIASIYHPNIVSYKECFVDQSNTVTPELCIIMEFAEEGDLLNRIQQQIKQQMYIHEKEIWTILINLLLGLKALHDRRIYHRDLKCANVFMFSDKRVKLGDFNVSKLAKKGLVYTQTGTPYYASPEVWQDKPYDHKADIWSLGCVIYETCTLKPPFRAKDMDGLYKAVMKGAFPPIPGIYSQELAQVIKLMLQVKPDMRPDCEKLLQMPCIQKRVEQPQPQEEQMQLLKTIKWPSSKKGLQQHKSEVIHLNLQLPGANYNTSSAINQANFNHIKRQGASNMQSNRIKSQDIQPEQTNESIQNILNQIGRLQKGKTGEPELAHNRSALLQENPSPKGKEIAVQYYPNIPTREGAKESSLMRSKRNAKKLLSEPHNQSKNDAQRNHLSMHQPNNQSNYSQLSCNENSTEVGIDEGILHEPVVQQSKVKKISETVEARRIRISNSQHERHDILQKNGGSKERLGRLQIDQVSEMNHNYYVRDVLSSLNKQQHSQKLPMLYQNSSYSRQHSSNVQNHVIEEEYQLDPKPSLGLRKNSNSSEKKSLVRVIKKIQPKPADARQERSNISLSKDSVQAGSAERLKKQYMDLEPLPKLQRMKN